MKRAAPKKRAAADRKLTSADVCEQFDVTRVTLDRWCQRGCPHDGGGKGKPRLFNLEEVAAWQQEKGITGEVGRPPEADDGKCNPGEAESLRAVKIRKEQVLTETYQLRLDKEKGQVMPVSDVEASNVRKFTTIRNKLLGMPAAAAPILAGMAVAEIEGELEARVRNILEELSRA